MPAPPAPLIDATAAMRRPLTTFATLVPLGLLAEIYRWLSEAKATPLAEQHWAQLGAAYGVHGGLPLVLALGLACLGLHLARRDPWHLPDAWLSAQILLWAVLWTAVRTAVAITGESLLGRSLPLLGMAQLDALAQLGYCFAGALQEETLYRGLLLGLGSWLLDRCGRAGPWLRWLLLLHDDSGEHEAREHARNCLGHGQQLFFGQKFAHSFVGLESGVDRLLVVARGLHLRERRRVPIRRGAGGEDHRQAAGARAQAGARPGRTPPPRRPQPC